MPATAIVLVFGIVLLGFPCSPLAEQPQPKLIQAKPAYQEATYVPEAQPPAAAPTGPPVPTPRDQMYVFWFLGKILSYPVDRVEAYIMSKFQRPALKPASAPSDEPTGSNPFDAIKLGEIPPAPPALGGAASRQR